MAGIISYFCLFVVFLHVCFPKTSLHRRFSDFKRCADEECSMLLCRGKAARDFSGPDCRFLSFKKGETIYVYYKLSGQRSDLWAGSVGSSFGYFPKDFLNINHIYTEEEIEIPAEETDFVCFDTGEDQFESYNTDLLLSNSLLNEGDKQNEEPEQKGPSEDAGVAAEDLDESHIEAGDMDVKDSEPLHKESEAEREVYTEDVSDLEPAEPSQLPLGASASDAKDKVSDVVKDNARSQEKSAQDARSDPEEILAVDIPDEQSPKDAGVLQKSDHVTQVKAVPELKTTLGTTFDAVVSNDEHTWKVSPSYDEEESKTLVVQPSEQTGGGPKQPALLSFEGHIADPAESKGEDLSLQPAAELQKEATKATEDMWSSLGDTVYKIVSGGERTDLPGDSIDEEEEEDTDTGETQNNALQAQDSEIAEDADEIKHSKNDFMKEDLITNVTQYIDFSEQDSKELKSENEVEDIESNDESESSENTLDLDETENKNKKSKLSKKTLTLDEKEIENNDKSEHANNFDLNERENKDNDKSKHSENKLDLNEREINNNDKSKRSKNNFDLTEREIEDNDKSEHSDNLDLDERENKNNYRSEHSGNNLDLNNREIENDVSEYSENNLDLNERVINSNDKSKHSENKLDLNEREIEDNDKSEHSKNNLDLTEREIDDNDKSEHSKNYLDLIESEIENDAKSEFAKKMLDLDETLYDAVAESEPNTPAYNLEDKPAKTATDNIVLETDINKIELHKSEGLAKAQGAQKSPQFDEKRDEQIDRVKNNIINLFEDTLKAESKPEADDDPEVYEENVDNELLEDENAVSSSKTDLTDEEGEQPVENGEMENAKLASPKQPTENLPKQTNERTQKQTSEHTKASLDLSVSTHAKETDAQSTEVDGVSSIKQDLSPSKEPEYSDSVLRLTLLRDHFKDSEIERLQWYLGLKDLFRIEAMFTELDQKLKTARESDLQAGNDMERKLESIVEVSENSILDEIEKLLDAQEQKAQDLGRQMDPVILDHEAAILDDFQEFIFYLYQKYSAVSDSVPLVEENRSHSEIEKLQTSEEEEDSSKHIPVPEVTETPKVHEKSDKISSVNVQEDDSHSQDMSLEEDGGHFNKNKDIQAGFKETEEMQRGPQAILENPVDIAFGFEMEPSSGSLESPRTSDFYDNNANYDQASASTSDHVWDLLAISFGFLGVYSETLIAALPEEWQPGPTFHGLPWKPVVVTAIVGILTALMLIWRTVLVVKSRVYLLNEKQLEERIHQLVSEKSDVLLKITELNNMIKQHEEKLNNSEKSQSSMLEKYEDLKVHDKALQGQREEMSASIYHLGQKITETQEKNKALNEKMEVMHQRIEKYQSTLKLYDEERSKVQVLMDEAKLREDALKAQVLSFEKDNSALKEQKKSLLRDAKDWQEKHEKLSEEIKVYHKTRKDLEDALVHKENEIDALSSCIAELKSLELCDPEGVQKGDAKLANGEMADKGDHIKLRLKQMMDVSRIKVTLSVIEDERNRYLENFLTEQKARHELEEQFQKVIHDQTNLKNEKTHLESQYNNLQQRLEITTELYQQKENALQQKLTQEELERREKESELSEVDGRTLQAEEELSGLKKKVKDMQKEMQQNERSLRAEIAVQEKKAHENWLKARASERALMEERRESANLRQKMVECSDKMADLEHALYKSGPSDRHMNPPLRIGDSYGPSPVSGGAPSPPLMIEGPGRPPSAPVGRRNEPFGPRPIDTGRFSDLGHPVPSRPEMYAPRTSSPCTQDGSQTTQVDAKTEASVPASAETAEPLSKSQNQGLFLPSPIRDSPEASSNPPQKAYSSQHMGGPPSNGVLPPMSRPPNDLLPMMSSGPPLGQDPRFRPPHMDSYGPPPLRPYGPVPPPFARGLPRRDLPPRGPPPPPFGMHDFPPDFAGPRDLPFLPRPYASGSVPPPGALVPPLFGSREPRGPVPPMSHPTRDNEDIRQATDHAAEDPGQQRAEQHTTTSAVAEP